MDEKNNIIISQSTDGKTKINVKLEKEYLETLKVLNNKIDDKTKNK